MCCVCVCCFGSVVCVYVVLEVLLLFWMCVRSHIAVAKIVVCVYVVLEVLCVCMLFWKCCFCFGCVLGHTSQ